MKEPLEAARSKSKRKKACSAVDAFKIACKTAEALADQCRYLRYIGEEPSELAEEALQECVLAGYLPITNSPSNSPSFDADGYPTEETELAITKWDFEDVPGWLEYIRQAWNHHYGRMWKEKGKLKMATGGWSGNESIIYAMKENYRLWSLLWESSHCGGLEVFKVPNKR